MHTFQRENSQLDCGNSGAPHAGGGRANLVMTSLSDRPYERPPLYGSHREMSHSTCAATRVFSAGSGMAYFF